MTRAEELQAIERKAKLTEARKVQMGAILVSVASAKGIPVFLADDVTPGAKLYGAAILEEVCKTRPRLRQSLKVVFEWPRTFVQGGDNVTDTFAARALTAQRQVWTWCQSQRIPSERVFFPNNCPPESMFHDPWPRPGEQMSDHSVKPDVSINWWFFMAHRLLDDVAAPSVWYVSPWTASHRGIEKALKHICSPQTPPVTTSIFTNGPSPNSCGKAIAAKYTFNL